MQASPLNDPDIVAEMVRNLPIKEFRKHFKINRLWYNCCKAELWKWHKEAEQVYGRAADEDKKARKAYWQTFEGDRKNVNKAYEECEKAHDKKYTSFKEMVDIEQAILRCGFVTKESDLGEYIWMSFNIQLLKNGFTPDDIGYPSDDEEYF
ncbi:hypothetical protein RhiirC2_821398 [Rhizophagus irregularis]|uniref:F-box domain-containing protein n=1 Tax=Rhizophagus irregularis TaxID=588596 RepID=A0A2N1MC84_9GLOM|nr:hypothetical protein RhiirC2_821398 [Rhizophagus irregularis]